MPRLVHERGEQFHDRGAVSRVELTGRLVRRGAARGRATGPRAMPDPLLLPAGQLCGPLRRVVGEPDEPEHLRHPRRPARRSDAPDAAAGTSTFSAAVSTGDQPEGLEHDATRAARGAAVQARTRRGAEISAVARPRPAVGRSSPPSRLSSVVLPAPDGHRSTTQLAGRGRSRSTSPQRRAPRLPDRAYAVRRAGAQHGASRLGTRPRHRDVPPPGRDRRRGPDADVVGLEREPHPVAQVEGADEVARAAAGARPGRAPRTPPRRTLGRPSLVDLASRRSTSVAVRPSRMATVRSTCSVTRRRRA